MADADEVRRGIPGTGVVKFVRDDAKARRVMHLTWPVQDAVTGQPMQEFKDFIMIDDIELKRRVKGTSDPIPSLLHALGVIKMRWQALNQTSGDFILEIHDKVVLGLHH